jgi:predicted GTPase
MTRWRIVVLVSMVGLPVLFLLGVGSYHLWATGWLFYAWWPMAGSLALAYFLAWRWQRRKKLLPRAETPPLHWTDRDHAAWKLVEARAAAMEKVDPDRFAESQFFFDIAHEMALELARFYTPNADDPFGPLTLPEILAVVELAAHDMSELVGQYLPAGHILTINDWKRARQAADWYRRASNVYWATAAVLNPVQTALRYAATKFGLTAQFDRIQANVILWFVTTYVERTGNYLIELNSGRLKVGATRYLQLRERHTIPRTPPAEPTPAAPDESVRQVTLTLMGQVKAGKSSTINGLLGERQAVTDVLPATAEVKRYSVQPADIPSKLVLLDTVGYGHTGPREDQLRETENAAQQSDLILLVLHARNPARKADVEALDRLSEWFAGRPELKMPPVLLVQTHIDLLTPAMEWQPPYDWLEPKRLKEQSIHRALDAAREQFAGRAIGAVPVCAAEGRVYGFEEWLLPALAENLDRAHAVALVRTLRAEADANKVGRVIDQLRAAGKQAAKIFWQSAGK